MNFLSTLFVVILFIFFLPLPAGIISFCCIFLYKDKRSFLCLLIFLMSLFLLIILYVPNNSDDLTRYFGTMRNLEYLTNWKEFVSFSTNDYTMKYQQVNKIFNFLEYIIARSRFFTILPAISCVVTYFSILYPVIDLKNRSLISKKNSIIVSIGNLLLFYLFFSVNTMRWSLACALFYFVVYLYFFKIKKVTYLWLLLLPLLFHVGILLGVIIALYVALFKKTNFWSLTILISCFVIFLFYSKNGMMGQDGGVLGQVSGMVSTYSNDFMNRNMNGMIVLYLNRFGTWGLILSFFVFLLKTYQITMDSIVRMFMLQILFFILLTGNSMIQNRYMIIVSAFSLLFFSIKIDYVSGGSKIAIQFLTLMSLCLFFIPAFVANRNINFTIPLWQIFFSNVISLLKVVPIF
ncbi:EpsG family protein [Ligilactobacillus acidipiscis]|uniref:EpsG family protein n=1 Tax=Ligilactobacillus acidipiscis TaxID=89059 RepID=UPI0023F7CB7B|nr:EpsG family protein [Ligilactobacillus acidipiscis]WEV56542.1 EpsG family protein [Ligilactobacillus acidipiscis]